MSLIERLRDTASKGISAWGDLQLEAADELERLTAEEKMQLEQIVNQGLEIERLTGASKSYEAQANKDCLEIERLTAELTTSRYWREQEVKDLTAELARAKEYHAGELADVVAERDALKSAVLGSKALIAELQSERVALAADAARYRWLKSGCENATIGVWNCLDEQNRRIWLAESELDDAIDAAIQGAGK